MNIDTLTAFLGWCTVLNMALLLFTTILLTGMRKSITSLHSRMMGVEGDQLAKLYMQYLGTYKTLIFIFNLAPYFALKMMMS